MFKNGFTGSKLKHRDLSEALAELSEKWEPKFKKHPPSRCVPWNIADCTYKDIPWDSL